VNHGGINKPHIIHLEARGFLVLWESQWLMLMPLVISNFFSFLQEKMMKTSNNENAK